MSKQKVNVKHFLNRMVQTNTVDKKQINAKNNDIYKCQNNDTNKTIVTNTIFLSLIP
jgi:hypothetical protein